MPRWNHATLLYLMAATTGCVGTLDPNTGGDDGNPTGGQARKMFDEDVSPVLEQSCASCHAGTGATPYKYLGTVGPSDNYAMIEGDPSMNGGWVPEASQFSTHTHSGGQIELTAAQKMAVRNWIVQEAMERHVDTQPPPTGGDRTMRDALAHFAACMQQTDWQASGMASWADKATSGGTCKSCHTYGAGGYLAIADDTQMFTMNRYEIFVGMFFKAEAAGGGLYKVAPNDTHACSKSDGASGGHPSYLCPDNYVTILQDFVTRTNNSLAACTATPGFPTPPPPAP